MGNSQTRVDVRITPATGDHPAHIHMGSCANLNPTPEIPLTNVQNGTSTTVVNQALATIQGQQRAVNLHMSAADLATYVACGDIPLVGTQVAQCCGPGCCAPAPQTNVGGGQAAATCHGRARRRLRCQVRCRVLATCPMLRRCSLLPGLALSGDWPGLCGGASARR